VDGPTEVIDLAHQNGLFVHAFTFRNDASGYGFSDPQEEMEYYFRAGVDGVFTDFPDTGVAARNAAVPGPGVLSLLGIAALGALRLRRRGLRRAA
jgi:glycerophosphoryl diester phosphodiesterase